MSHTLQHLSCTQSLDVQDLEKIVVIIFVDLMKSKHTCKERVICTVLFLPSFFSGAESM